MAVTAVSQIPALQIGQLASLSHLGIGMPGPLAATGMMMRTAGTMVAASVAAPMVRPSVVSPFLAAAPRIQFASSNDDSVHMVPCSFGVQGASGNAFSFPAIVAARESLAQDGTTSPQLNFGIGAEVGELPSMFLATPAVAEEFSSGAQGRSEAQVAGNAAGVKSSRRSGSKSGQPVATGRYDGQGSVAHSDVKDSKSAALSGAKKAQGDKQADMMALAAAADVEAQVEKYITVAQAVSRGSQWKLFGDADDAASDITGKSELITAEGVGSVAEQSDGRTAQIIELSAVMASVVRDAADLRSGSSIAAASGVKGKAEDLPDAAITVFPGAFDARAAVSTKDKVHDVSEAARVDTVGISATQLSRSDVIRAANENRVVVDGRFGDVPVRRTYLRVIDSNTGAERLVFAGWSEARPSAVALPQGMSIDSWMQILGRTAPELIFSVVGPGGESAQRQSPGDLEAGELESRFTSSILSQISMGPESLGDTSILDAFNAYLLGTQSISQGDTISGQEWQMYLKESLRLAIRHTPIFDMDGLRNIIDVQDNAALVLRTELQMFYAWEQHFGTETITEQLFEGESSPVLALPDGDIRRELYLALDEALEVRAGMSLDIVTEDGVSQAEDTGIQWDVAVASLIEDSAIRARAAKAKIVELNLAGKDRLAARMLALIVLHSEVSEGAAARAAARDGVKDVKVASKGTA
ncbi:MAG: hypothetical protein HN337_09665 [Deltaproteobacteria bacterium]|jgi:hypothetical protein|nr:hypothetical protein [Deltaproteobacteria bacterium]